MSAVPLPKIPLRRSLFSDAGERTAKLPLIEAVYFDRTQRAEAIIESDPAQINLQEPFAGLSALHIAVFRQNVVIVRKLTDHPVTDMNLADRFGRKPIDMCLYSTQAEIVEAITNRTYRAAILELKQGDASGIIPIRRD
jgi:hypothetical protein